MEGEEEWHPKRSYRVQAGAVRGAGTAVIFPHKSLSAFSRTADARCSHFRMLILSMRVIIVERERPGDLCVRYR